MRRHLFDSTPLAERQYTVSTYDENWNEIQSIDRISYDGLISMCDFTPHEKSLINDLQTSWETENTSCLIGNMRITRILPLR